MQALGLASPQHPGKIRKVELLGYKGELKWKQDGRRIEGRDARGKDLRYRHHAEG